jgi:threonine dehydratase
VRPLHAEDVHRARERIRPYLAPTPLRPAFALRSTRALVKLECWQPTGSFKVRGALAVLTGLSADERTRGVVAASAGNHALGVAFAAEALGGLVAATVVVPESAPRAKIEKLRAFRVELKIAGADYDEAFAVALELASRRGAALVHAFDDPITAAGQGTVGLEILEQRPDVGTILIPVGGGGLLAGAAVAVKAAHTDVRIVAVQPEASPALRESIRLGRPLLTYAAAPTLADGLAGGIGQLVFAHRHLVDDVVTVTESEIEAAIAALVTDDQIVAEASGAVGVAALLANRSSARGSRPAVAIVTGANLDAAVLARILSARMP